MSDRTLSSGVRGLDDLIDGGYPAGHVYLIRGEPGTGKTTMALQFLGAGRDAGERCLYLTLSQTSDELGAIAASHELSMADVEVVDADALFAETLSRQTVLNTSEIELTRLTAQLKERIERLNPSRIVLDSLIDLRVRSADILAYRRLIRSLIDMLVEKGATALFLDSDPEFGGDSQIAALVHGVISLQRALPGYGVAQRRLEVNKMRAVNHSEGLHDFTIAPSGLRVFPRLTSASEDVEPSLEVVSAGLQDLDELLGGGLELGTTGLVFGQSGVGKSTLAAMMMSAALERGEHAAGFLFEEHAKTFIHRAEGVGLPLRAGLENGRLHFFDLRAGELLPGEFVHHVLDVVDQHRIQLLVIDSVSGYLTAAALKDHALAQLNTLLSTLRSRRTATILVAEQAGLMTSIGSSVDISVLADTVMLARQYEAQSSIRRSVAVVKKRTGPHSTELRELRFSPGKLEISKISFEHLSELRGAKLLSSSVTI